MTKSFKYDREVIKPSNEEVHIEFDKNGRITKIIEINPFRHRKDSIITQFYRNSDGRPNTIVKHDPRYTYVELVTYNNGGREVKRENYQMHKSLKWEENLYPGKLMWADSLAYVERGIEVYNKFETRYKTFSQQKDAHGQVIEEKEYNRSKNLVRTRNFEYYQGAIHKIKEDNIGDLFFDWAKHIEYDELLRIKEIQYYKQGELNYVRRITYLENGLPELDLIRYNSTGKMNILKITYFK